MYEKMPTESNLEKNPKKKILNFTDGLVQYSSAEGENNGGCTFELIQELIDNGAEVKIMPDEGENIIIKKISPKSIHGFFEDSQGEYGSTIENLNEHIHANLWKVTMTESTQ